MSENELENTSLTFLVHSLSHNSSFIIHNSIVCKHVGFLSAREESMGTGRQRRSFALPPHWSSSSASSMQHLPLPVSMIFLTTGRPTVFPFSHTAIELTPLFLCAIQ